MANHAEKNTAPIAIVGMAIRVPGADNLDRFWDNIINGVDCLTRSNRTTLRHSYADPDRVGHDDFIPSTPALENYDEFDADLFGMTPFDAERTDPAQKIFMECCHEALEHSNTAHDRKDLRISVFGGSESNYLQTNLKEIVGALDHIEDVSLAIGNEIDFLSTRVSYRLNLTGPSLSVMAACATSLMAVHLAVSSLRRGESNVALAGGASIIKPEESGYFAGIDGMFSTTGRVRPFDMDADGTVFGKGAGVVVLRPLEDAIKEGLKIYGVIKGTGASNDGNPPGKPSFTAPSPEGQTQAIQDALDDANIDPATIGYIETHGTGTRIGDPTELDSISRVYRKHTSSRNFCSVGSVKGNIGHLRTAAGVVGLIKTCLILDKKVRPPIANFNTINPRINLEDSPFRMETEAMPWADNKHPLRAGISSFGFGGTNVHVVAEAAPPQATSNDHFAEIQLGTVSASSASALERRVKDLAQYVDMHPEANRTELAHTLQVGRSHMKYRTAVLMREGDSNPFRKPLELQPRNSEIAGEAVFLFPGQGSQFPGMGRALYGHNELFTKIIDQCDDLLESLLGLRISTMMFSNPEDDSEQHNNRLHQTSYAQPALFVIEYALARELIQQGLTPVALLGHSVGELVAACIAGVFSLEDGLKIVAARGRLMQSCETGEMVAVVLSESELIPLLPTKVEIAAINGPGLSVVSGPAQAINDLEQVLSDAGHGLKRLLTSHAFHSWMMDPALPQFRDELSTVSLSPPTIPIYSNRDGQIMTAEQATSHEYWSDHIRNPVQFAKSVENVLEDINPIFLEVGPGKTLCDFVRQQQPDANVFSITHSGGSGGDEADVNDLLKTIGSMWQCGVNVNWLSSYDNKHLPKLSLPTYPYQRQRHWIEPGGTSTVPKDSLCMYSPVWSPADCDVSENLNSTWILLLDDSGVKNKVCEKLEQLDQEVVIVRIGDQYSKISDREFTIRPQSREDSRSLFGEMKTGRNGQHPHRFHVVHAWSLGGISNDKNPVDHFCYQNSIGYHSVVALIQAAHETRLDEQLDILVASTNIFCLPHENLETVPEKSTLLGPVKGAIAEFSDLRVRLLDLGEWDDGKISPWMIDGIIEEARSDSTDRIVARRENQRFVESLGNLDPMPASKLHLRLFGTVFITGGTGGLGFEIAEELYRCAKSKLILTCNWEVPVRESWKERTKVDDKIGRALTKVLELESKGAEVLLVKADCANPQNVTTAIEQARKSFGDIHGVIHAANSGNDILLLQQEPANTINQFAVKVHGALTLEDVFESYPLDFFIHFSSQASYQPAPGQAAYAGANAVLNALAERRNRTHAGLNCALAWGAWEQVGMAVTHANKKIAHQKNSGPDTTSAVGTLDHPLVTQKRVISENQTLYFNTFHPDDHWAIDSHVFKGTPLIAGALITECFRAAIVDYFGSPPWIELFNLAFMNPLFVPLEGVEVEIGVTREQQLVTAILRSRPVNNDAEQEWSLNSTTAARVLDTRPEPVPDLIPVDLDALSDHENWAPMEGKHLTGDKRWSCQWERRFEDNLTWAHICATDPEIDPNEFGIHPALMDNGILSHSERLIGAYVPATIDSIRIYESLGVDVYTFANNDEPDEWRYNCRYFDAQGETLMDIRGDVVHPIEGSFLVKHGGIDQANTRSKDAGEPMNRERTRLNISNLGDLDGIHLEPYTCPPPGRDEVKIKVVAAGVNFRDVLTLLGQLPPELGGTDVIGIECSGYVVETGANVTGFSVGDAVLAIGSGCFSGQVNINAHWVALIPDGVVMEHAAGILTTFLTADYALFELARLQPGEKVLIHAGAGGVGLAAVQLASKCGAEIFATAGHERKHQYLKLLGVDQVLNSRSTDFSDEILELTSEEGVDVVLNSLGGDFIEASLKTLGEFGRFIEIGKRDLIANSSLGLKPFLNNLSYSGLDIGKMISISHTGLRKRMTDLLQMFANGELECSPTTVYDIADAANAFKTMSRGDHIGKLVLRICEHEDAWRAMALSFHEEFGKGITPKTGLKVFNRLLRSDSTPGVIVATPASLDIAKDIKAMNLAIDSGTHKRPEMETEYVPAVTETEIFLANLFERMIGITGVGIEDNFFELGGDSITAIQVQYAVTREYDLQLSAATLSNYLTIAELAVKIGELGTEIG